MEVLPGISQRLRRWVARVKFETLDPVLLLVLLASGFVLLYRLSDPEGSLIFDESYYVQMARVILGWPVLPDNLPEHLYSGCDPNSEHPPLAKLIMATGMYFFRDDAIGWRLPSVILGLIGIQMIYSIVRALGGSQGQARLSAFVLAFDNLYFVHSRIATLDIYMVSFALVGVWLYMKRRYEFSGLAFGLATVCKINGLLWVFGIFLYELGKYGHERFRTLESEEQAVRAGFGWNRFLLMFACYSGFSFFTLGAMDCYWTEFQGPVAHVRHIFSYGTSLSREVGVGPQGAESTPLQWWLNEKNFEYLQLAGVANDISTTIVSFRGCMSIYLISAAPFVLVFSLLRARKGDKLALLIVCLFLANYVPMLLTWVKARRICYLYYMLPSLPSFSMGIGLALYHLPAWTRGAFVLATLYTFVSLFPFKA